MSNSVEPQTELTTKSRLNDVNDNNFSDFLSLMRDNEEGEHSNPKSYLERTVSEFLETADHDADSWLLFILEGYMSGDAIYRTDASMRAVMMRNFNRIVELVRAIQKGSDEGKM